MKTKLVMFAVALAVALFCAAAILAPAVAGAEDLYKREGTVVSSRQVYYDKEICWEIIVQIGDEEYAYYDNRQYSPGQYMTLTMAGEKIVDATMTLSPAEAKWMPFVEICLWLFGIGIILLIILSFLNGW